MLNVSFVEASATSAVGKFQSLSRLAENRLLNGDS
jgi:hypothetical protein